MNQLGANATGYMTEDDVKKAGLSHLRNYYRFFPRSSDSIGKLDLLTTEGIVVDVSMSFTDAEGKPFLATLEATSLGTVEEVRYVRQKQLLFWDTLTTSSVCMAFLLVINRLFEFISIVEIGVFPFFLLLFLIWVLLYVVCHFLLRPKSRYRYIYGVEQFKKYFADDQWIAIAHDVLPDPTDKYLVAIHKQCVKYGFGFVRILENGFVHTYCNPSRVDQFEGRRKTISFVERAALLQAHSIHALSAKLQKWIHVRPDSAIAIGRYQRNYYTQQIISVIAWACMSVAIFFHYQELPVHFLEDGEFEAMLRSRTIEPHDMPDFQNPYDDSTFVSQRLPDIAYPEEIEEETPLRAEKALWFDPSIAKGWVYDCNRICNFTSVKYALVYEIVQENELMVERCQQLHRDGWQVYGVALDCFKGQDVGYAILFGPFFNDVNEAGDYERQLRSERKFALLGEQLFTLMPLQCPQ